MKFVSHSENETKKLAHDIAKKLRGGEILTLRGELGAGKTTFVKGVAHVLGIKERIQSPTFVLMKVFDVPTKSVLGKKIKTLTHIDAYRLKSAGELKEIGVNEYLGQPNTITIIEWPENVKELLTNYNKKIIEIIFSHGSRINERIIELIK